MVYKELPPCGEPTVIAGMPAVLADSCSEVVSFRGATYATDCNAIHRSREGEWLVEGLDLFSDKTGSTYVGIRSIEGFHESEAVEIVGGDPLCRRGRHSHYIAVSDSLSVKEQEALEDLMETPLEP